MTVAAIERKRESRRRWYAKNREEQLQKKRLEYQAHRDECIARSRRYYREHRADVLEKDRQRYLARRDAQIAYQRQRKLNRMLQDTPDDDFVHKIMSALFEKHAAAARLGWERRKARRHAVAL